MELNLSSPSRQLLKTAFIFAVIETAFVLQKQKRQETLLGISYILNNFQLKYDVNVKFYRQHFSLLIQLLLTKNTINFKFQIILTNTTMTDCTFLITLHLMKTFNSKYSVLIIVSC